MLDGLLGRSGFSSKCKSLIKPTRTRIEVLRRRAEAKQRFLKEDLAKLLANGLDVNAYGRTEDFIAGLNMLSCYNFLDQSCEYILKQLSVMQKQGQCPEECRETVASLMFAAARFSDLPELRDLRDVFQDRYGNGLECYVNQAFVEKLASKPPIVEKRIKLLQDIATELTIQWDSKGFKERMDKPSTLDQDQGRKLGPSSVTDEKYKVQNGNNVFRKSDQRSKEKIEHIHEGPILNNDGNGNIRRKEVLDIPFVRKEERHAQDQAMKLGSLKGIDDKYKVPNGNFVFKKHDQHPKERTKHSREGPTLHNHDKYMVPNGNDVFRKSDQSSKERIEHPREGPTLHHHDKYRVPNGNDFFRKNDQSSKERIEDSHEGQTLHNHDKYRVPNGNDVFRKNDRSSKDRIENSHEGPTLHTPDKYRVPNGNDVFLKSDQSSKERIEDAHEGPTLHNHDKYRVPNGSDVYRKNDKSSRERIEYSHEGSTLHNHDKYKVPNGNDVYRKNDQRFKERIEDSPEGPTLHNHDKYRVPNGHDLFRKRYQSSKEKIEDSHEGPTLHDHDMYRVPNVNDIHRKNERIEEEPIRVKPCSNASLPPPYVKSNLPPPYTKPNNHHEPPAADRHSSGDLSPLDQPNSDRRKKERNEHRHYQNDTPIPILPLPKPRSIRRKHSKSSSGHDDVGSSEDSSRIVKRISSSRRKERKGLQILFDDDEHYYHHRKTDEEEKMMDKLLLHYSKKPSSYYDKKSRKKKSKSPDDEAETVTPPMRSISLPHESEPKKVYARANSFQPDNQAPHVHPKLPDYDDLAARFAALRGR